VLPDRVSRTVKVLSGHGRIFTEQRRSVWGPSVCRAAQGKAGMESYRQFESDRDRGDFEGLPELHATLSGMKVRRVLAARPGCPSRNTEVRRYWDFVLPPRCSR